ncbi:hypothetical protein QWY85_13625 [Neolewinella lacunae]|uniref:Contractile injection system tube protein N-terminal domain-containing protein n=1 Tax=Neolewinella lacunae TaxID=1517758 RepID=A0A923T6B6_9BACT|nr:hypothetical protein [Neolewinella lacunae]MBC6993250.1 hypothetical protein [Neolewinella lacunae]MDN3635703.1 hypothetical protein [Neolewinella lacunae]
MLGPLEKMKILAFTDSEYTRPATVPAFPVLVNPESYAMDHAIEYNTETATGSTGSEAAFVRKNPEVFSCELHFDNTGILDGLPRPDVHVELEAFKAFLLDVESETHEPRHFMIIWGKMIFKGRVTAMNIKYKLFAADGTPIRATVELAFKGSFSDLLRLAIDNLLSPDLTHLRVIRAGDTLANLCQEIYGDTSQLMAVARANGLSSFRSLAVGSQLAFPPLQTRKV